MNYIEIHQDWVYKMSTCPDSLYTIKGTYKTFIILMCECMLIRLRSHFLKIWFLLKTSSVSVFRRLSSLAKGIR